MVSRLFVPSLLLVLASCESPEDASPARSSDIEAGVEVLVADDTGAWSDGQEWTVEEVLTIGLGQTDAAYQFGSIAGLDVAGNGNIYVADEGAGELRVFDSDGVHVDTIGRGGSGPGEFGSNLEGVFVIGDEVFVPDLANARVSSFGLEGDYRDSERIEVADGVPIRTDRLPEVGIIAQRRQVTPGHAAPSADVLAGLGGSGDALVELEPVQSVQITGGLPKIDAFAPDPVWDSSHDGRLVTATSGAWRFRFWNPDGTIRHIVERSVTPMEVTEADRRSVQEDLGELYESQGLPNAIVADVMERMEFNPTFPAFSAIALGPRGTTWVQKLLDREEMTARGATVAIEDMGSETWSVLSERGEYLGDVTFPRDFRPVRFVDDLFYGVARNELDVETVAVFRVVMDD